MLGTQKVTAMKLKRINKIIGKKGQQFIEYAVVAGIVAAVMVAMSTYVYRAVQATQQEIQKEFNNE